jgi:hypothetical protein
MHPVHLSGTIVRLFGMSGFLVSAVQASSTAYLRYVTYLPAGERDLAITDVLEDDAWPRLAGANV